MARKKSKLDVSAEVTKLTEKFTADLQALIERAVAERTADVAKQLADLQQALGSIVGTKAVKPKLRKRPRARTSTADAKKPVLAALKKAGEPVGSATLQKATGLNAAKIRTVMTALMEEEKVGKEGEKRSTVYFLTGGK